MIRPTLLVSLLVGRAGVRANQLATMVAVNSVLASDLPAVFDCKLYALVNGARDECGALVEELESRGFAAHVTARNLGIGEGRNDTMRRALAAGERPDYYLELHNDFVFPAAWSEALLAAFRADAQLGLLGVTIFTGRGYWDSEALGLDLATEDWRDLVAKVEAAKLRAVERYRDTKQRIRRGITCPWIGRWSALCDPQVGGPLYPAEFGWQEYEDTDLVRRLEDGGYRCGVTVDAFAYHHYLFSRLTMRECLEDPRKRASFSKAAFFGKYADAVPWKAQFDEDCERMLAP